MSDGSAKPVENAEPVLDDKKSLGLALSEKFKEMAKPGEKPGEPDGPGDKAGESGFDASKMYRCMIKDEKTGLVCGRLIKNDREAIREHERRVHGLKVNRSRKPADKPVDVPALPIDSAEQLKKVVVPARLPRPEDIKPREAEKPGIVAVEQDRPRVVVPEIVGKEQKTGGGMGDLVGLLFLGLLIGGLSLAAWWIMKGPGKERPAKPGVETPIEKVQNVAEQAVQPPVVQAPVARGSEEGPKFLPPGVPIQVR